MTCVRQTATATLDLRFVFKKNDCHRCVNYFVTWDAQFPHGCRAMGFKSYQSPIATVRNAMGGADCLLFEEKRIKIKKRDYRVGK